MCTHMSHGMHMRMYMHMCMHMYMYMCVHTHGIGGLLHAVLCLSRTRVYDPYSEGGKARERESV